MNTPPLRPIRVWDAPVRVFHWLMVASFAGAWLTAESERWALLHVTLGYTMAGLIVFRLLWGLLGTRHARFADFVRGPRAVLAYLGSLLRGRPEHHTGHNPAGGWMIVALLALAALTTLSGWATYAEVGGDWLEELHEGAASAMLGLVIVHVAAVVLGSLAHRENLVRAMVTGRKRGDPGEPSAAPWRSVAALLLAGVLGFWALQWQQAPDVATTTARAAANDRHHGHDRDDD
ncbi:MAG TPA: cytochrome b/b6 domain-containing protein [Ideonella sp.]|nr:cytochrome b/b6 domain-containing protein [Ideonella sp.]